MYPDTRSNTPKPTAYTRKKIVPDAAVTRALLLRFIEDSTPPTQTRPSLRAIDTAIQNLILRTQDSGFFDVRKGYLAAKNAIISVISPTAPQLTFSDQRIRIRPFPEAQTPLHTSLIKAFQALEIALSAHHPSLYFPPIPFQELQACNEPDFLNAIGIHTDTRQTQNPELWRLFEESFDRTDYDTQIEITLKLSTAVAKFLLYNPTRNPTVLCFIERQTQRLFSIEKDKHPFPSEGPYFQGLRRANPGNMMTAVGLSPTTHTLQNTNLWQIFKEDLVQVSPEEARLTTDVLSATVLQDCLHNAAPLLLPTEITRLFNQVGTLKWQIYQDAKNEHDHPVLLNPLTQKVSLRLPASTDVFLKRGAYGEVFLVKNTSDQDIVIKSISLNTKHYLKNVAALLNEIQLSRAVHHLNILPIQEAFMASDALGNPKAYLTMAYCSEGTLHHFVFAKTAPLKDLWRSHKTQWEDELVDAVASLHAQKIGHADLKLENILVTTDLPTNRLSIKLTDFGFAAYFDDESHHSKGRGTPHITPPEVMRHALRLLPERRDLWELGITLFELNTGRSFTRLKNHHEIQRMVLTFCVDTQLRASILKFVDNSATAHGISRLLSSDPRDRISAHTLKTDYLQRRSATHYRQDSLQAPCSPRLSEEKSPYSIWNLDGSSENNYFKG